MLDLEYLLLFGVPKNKWELFDGRVRWAFPFLDRDIADAHFAAWADTLKHWRGATGARAYDRAPANGSPRRVFRGDGIEMSLYPGCDRAWRRACRSRPISAYAARQAGSTRCRRRWSQIS